MRRGNEADKVRRKKENERKAWPQGAEINRPRSRQYHNSYHLFFSRILLLYLYDRPAVTTLYTMNSVIPVVPIRDAGTVRPLAMVRTIYVH